VVVLLPSEPSVLIMLGGLQRGVGLLIGSSFMKFVSCKNGREEHLGREAKVLTIEIGRHSWKVDRGGLDV
jgi:hypothetical protein